MGLCIATVSTSQEEGGNPPIFSSRRRQELCGHDQPLLRGESAQCHARAFAIAIPDPLCPEILYFVDRAEQVLREPFIPYGAV